MITLQELARALGGEIACDEVLAPGPGHSSKDRSLSVKPEPNAPAGLLIHSFANDDPQKCRDHVLTRLGIHRQTHSRKSRTGGFHEVAVYPYRDETSTILFEVVRQEKPSPNGGKPEKKFHQRRVNADGTRTRGTKGAKQVPYRAPELRAAIAANETIFIPEGEKCVHALAALDLAATCNAGGAGKWPDELTPPFKGADVIILPDNDGPGQDHARLVARKLHGTAKRVRILDLPNLHAKGDIADWLAKGGTREELFRLISEQGREASAAAAAGQDEGAAGGETEKRRRSQADILIKLSQSAEPFHTPDGTAYADINISGHRETWPIRSTKGFRRWLARGFFEATEGAPSSEALQSALNVIEAKAHFDAPERHIHIRVGEHDGKLYLDLCDETWRVVEIDATGWRVINSPPVRFKRSAGMKALPAPVRGGSINELRPFLNLKADKDFVLAVAWVLAVLRNRGPYPVIVLSGEQGSAKSTFSAILRALLDPNTAPLRALPREDRDLFIAASNAHVLAFDNVAGLPAWISDTLCRLATGGGFAVRQLYTDQDETLFDASRPVILNGIEDFVTRPDLADRAIFLTLEPIPEERRRPEAEILADFEAAHPRILGVLLDVVAHGLRELPRAKLARLPRMADFALWASACETAMWPIGTFEAAYGDNRDGAVANVIDCDPVASAVRSFMETRAEWEGTATQLLSALEALAGERVIKSKTWPKAPHALSGRLRRIAASLRKIGIDVAIDRDSKLRSICLTTTPEEGERSSSASEASSPRGRPDERASQNEERASQKTRERHGSQRGGDANDARDAFCPTLGGRVAGEQSANDGEANPDTDFARRSKWRREA